MAKRRKRARDPLLDRLIGRALLASESVRKEFVERLADAIAEAGPQNEEGVIAVARAYLGVYEPLIAEHLSNAMILTWLAGYNEQVQKLPETVTRWMRDHAFWDQEPPEVPGIFGPGDASPPAVRFPKIEKAAETLFNRGLLTRPQYDRLSAAAKQATFTVAWIDDTKVIGQIRDALAQTIQEGPTLEGFRKNVEERLEASQMGAWHSETVYRTNLMSAYRDGKESLLQHPIVQEVFPFREYVATHDGRVRDEHLALETLGIQGTGIYYDTDPLWDYFSVPWDYNCRCITIPMRIADAARAGIEEAKEWLRTGVKPANPTYCLAKIPFRPKPGFGVRHGPLLSVGTASSVRMSAQPIRLGDVNPWQPFPGPRGGKRWRNTATGAVKYQKERPGAHETGGSTKASKRGVPSLPPPGRFPSGLDTMTADELKIGYIPDEYARGLVIKEVIRRLPDGHYLLSRSGMAAPSMRDAVSESLGYSVDAGELKKIVQGLSTLYPDKVKADLTLGLDSIELLGASAASKPQAVAAEHAPPRESPLSPDEETTYSRGQCHALTAAILSVIPSAEPWGLFDTRYDDEIKHSVTRLPNTQTFVDASGAVQGKTGLESLKHNFLDAEHTEWRRLDEGKLRSMVTGNKGATIRKALPAAKKVIWHAESLPPPSTPPPARQHVAETPKGTAAIQKHIATWTDNEKAADWKANGVQGLSFKAWFGDWESEPTAASKVVDKKGNPQQTVRTDGSDTAPDKAKPFVVYHSTDAEFEAFDPGKIGSTTDQGWLGRGFYFTTDTNVATIMRKKRTIAAYVNLRNPFQMQQPDWKTTKWYAIREALGLPESKMVTKEAAQEITDELKRRGHDGVIWDYSSAGYDTKEVVALDPTQIKSVDNRGTFNPSNPNIRMAT